MIASSSIYSVWQAMVIVGGIVTVAAIVGGIILAYAREEHGRPLFPFGARMRVERAKAHTEVLQEQSGAGSGRSQTARNQPSTNKGPESDPGRRPRKGGTTRPARNHQKVGGY